MDKTISSALSLLGRYRCRADCIQYRSHYGQTQRDTRVLTDLAHTTPAHIQLMELAKARGYASATRFPLQVEGEILGALIMASAEPEGFDDEELKLFNELADDSPLPVSATCRLPVIEWYPADFDSVAHGIKYRGPTR